MAARVSAGDWPTAWGRVQMGLDPSRRSGYIAYAPVYIAHLGWLERLQGNDVRALELGRTSIELSEEIPHAWCRAAAAGFHGTTLIQLGQTDEAVRVLERGAGQADKTGSESYLLRCLGPLAEATGSRDLLDRADRLLAGVRTPPGSAWMAGDFTYLAIARSWLAAGDPARARTVLVPMLAVAERVPWVSSLAEGSLVDAQAALALGRADEADRLRRRAADLADRHGLAQVGRLARATSAG